MKARRNEAGAGCYCTHESNCYYPSLPFNAGPLDQDQEARRTDEESGEELRDSTRRREVALKA